MSAVHDLLFRGIVNQGWLRVLYCANFIVTTDVVLYSQQVFVSAPWVNRWTLISAVTGPVAASNVAPAFTDEIGYAASVLSDASYPSLKELGRLQRKAM